MLKDIIDAFTVGLLMPLLVFAPITALIAFVNNYNDLAFISFLLFLMALIVWVKGEA
jgi:hypothetical protein